MTHFGVICPNSIGHINAMLCLARELQKRGHQIAFFGTLDAQAKLQTAGLGFQAIGEEEFPLGSMTKSLTQLGELRGLASLRYTIQLLKKGTIVRLRDTPASIEKTGVEALLVDQVTSEGTTIAEYVGIPHITVCNALLLNQEPSVPPFYTAWQYNPAWWAILRNQIGYKILNSITKPLRDATNEYRKKWNLPPQIHSNDRYSKLAQLSQQPPEFEFPRKHLPPWFHFTGPYHSIASREPVSFPYEQLSDKPLIYVSMGTILNQLTWIFQKIAAACAGLDAQLVISLGGSTKPESLPKLPGNPLVVEYAPQLELLPKATLTITPAGMNTTMESLKNGVPMVAIPITNDQPGVAARIAWTGTGELVPLKKASVSRLQKAIRRVLMEDSYKKHALRLQEAIERAGGVKRAADIVEKAISTGEPVVD
jgi:MGT family glycosyltransferase